MLCDCVCVLSLHVMAGTRDLIVSEDALFQVFHLLWVCCSSSWIAWSLKGYEGSLEGNCSAWSSWTYSPVEINRVGHSVSSWDLYGPSEWSLFISGCEALKSSSSGLRWRGLETAGWVQHIKKDYVQAQVSITFLRHHYLCLFQDWLLVGLMNALWGEIAFIPTDF